MVTCLDMFLLTSCSLVMAGFWQMTTLIPAWISNHMPGIVWDEITYSFLNFNGCTVEVKEWISNFIPHFLMGVITYPCWGIFTFGSVNFHFTESKLLFENWQIHPHIARLFRFPLVTNRSHNIFVSRSPMVNMAAFVLGEISWPHIGMRIEFNFNLSKCLTKVGLQYRNHVLTQRQIIEV